MEDWLRIYASMLKRLVDRNKKYLETDNTRLQDAIKKYLELWANLEREVSSIDKKANRGTVMGFVVRFLWFPYGVFSFVFDVLSSDIGGVLRTLRFSLEALEMGIIGDCCIEFAGKTLDEKLKSLFGMYPRSIRKQLQELRDRGIIDGRTMDLLLEIYAGTSSLLHSTSYGRRMGELFKKYGDLPSMALYYPDLEDLEPEVVEDVVVLTENFCDAAERLIESWKKCLTSI